MQTTSLQCKGQNLWTTCSGIKVLETRRIAQETAPVGLQEGAGGLSFTMVCIPVGMHGRPRVRDNHMAAVLYEKKTIAVLKTYYCEC